MKRKLEASGRSKGDLVLSALHKGLRMSLSNALWRVGIIDTEEQRLAAGRTFTRVMQICAGFEDVKHVVLSPALDACLIKPTIRVPKLLRISLQEDEELVRNQLNSASANGMMLASSSTLYEACAVYVSNRFQSMVNERQLYAILWASTSGQESTDLAGQLIALCYIRYPEFMQGWVEPSGSVSDQALVRQLRSSNKVRAWFTATRSTRAANDEGRA